MKNKLRGSLAILVATVIWGSAFIAQSVGMDYIGPFTFQTMRSVLAVPFLIIVIFLIERSPAKSIEKWLEPDLWKAGLPCGVALFIAAGLQQMGLVDTDAGKSAFLTAMYIVFVPLIGIFRKKKPSKWVPVSVVLGVVGLYFLSCMGATSISAGDLLLMGCAVAYAVQITCIDIFANEVDPVRLNSLSCAIVSLISAVVVVFTETPTWEAINGCWGSLLYAGVLSMGIAYTLQILGQKDVEASTASLLMSLESVFAVLSGWIVLGDTLSMWESIGCVLIFGAIVISQLPEKKKLKTA